MLRITVWLLPVERRWIVCKGKVDLMQLRKTHLSRVETDVHGLCNVDFLMTSTHQLSTFPAHDHQPIVCEPHAAARLPVTYDR